jgi:WD40 repeat protein
MGETGAEVGKTERAARSVFISYSRKDGVAAAHRLREVLTGAGCEVWLDTERIRGGSSWSKAIEEALDRCDVLVAVLSEGSYVSEICRAEQMWALREGKRVIPVLAIPAAPRPLHLSTLNYRTLPAQERELLEDVGAEPPPVAASAGALRYDTVPPLPQSFIAREGAVEALRNLLFSEGDETNIAVTAVAGMGGIGKTVLATALCRDTAVQRAFPDGIAWMTIGREWDGDFVARMREVGRALGEDVERGWDSKIACENRYRNILREKAALIVVDDVWKLEDLKPLLVDAPRSRFLFTTRDAGIARNVTSRRYTAAVLAQNEARLLLARAAGRKVTELPAEADPIIAACGGLAAAVSQIGASLRDVSAAEWRDTLAALETVDTGAIEELLPPGQKSFFRSLAVSIQAVPADLQERYLKLAVLLEDAPAPLPILQTLWNVKEAEARRGARYFVERSLGTWEAAEDPSRGIKLHDLQLDYVRACYPHRETLPFIHGAVRLSAHIVQRDPWQFGSQVNGRLLLYRGRPGMDAFLKDLAAGTAKPWLRALHPALDPPGTALLRTLAGHTWSVNGVAVTADGKRAVSASNDKTLKVWDLESGRELRTLVGHSDYVTGVALTADGRLAVSASRDETLKMWDVESGRELRTLEGHSGFVNGVALTADGKRAVSGSYDETLKVWDLESGRELRTLAGHSASVNGVAVTADGKRAVSASGDKTLKVWDVESGRELRTLEGHGDSVNGVALTADGRRAVSAADDKTLKVWNLESGREMRSLEGHSDSVTGVAVTADGQRAVSASRDHTLKVWDVESGRVLRTLEGHSDSVNCVAVTADGRRAVSASWDKTLKVWDLESRRDLPTLEGHADFVNGVVITGDGRRAVSGSYDGTLKVWDLESGRELRTLAGHSSAVAGVALTADGRRAVSASYDKTLKLWDVESGRELRTLEGHSSAVADVALTADGKRAVSASWDKTLKVWDVESGREVRTLAGHSSAVAGVALTADGKRAVSASYDETLKVWDLESGRELRTLEGHSSRVNSVALTADGQRAVSASYDNTLKVWDLKNGTCVATFHADTAVRCCAIAQQNIVAGDDRGGLHFLTLEE